MGLCRAVLLLLCTTLCTAQIALQCGATSSQSFPHFEPPYLTAGTVLSDDTLVVEADAGQSAFLSLCYFPYLPVKDGAAQLGQDQRCASYKGVSLVAVGVTATHRAAVVTTIMLQGSVLRYVRVGSLAQFLQGDEMLVLPSGCGADETVHVTPMLNGSFLITLPAFGDCTARGDHYFGATVVTPEVPADGRYLERLACTHNALCGFVPFAGGIAVHCLDTSQSPWAITLDVYDMSLGCDASKRRTIGTTAHNSMEAHALQGGGFALSWTSVEFSPTEFTVVRFDATGAEVAHLTLSHDGVKHARQVSVFEDAGVLWWVTMWDMLVVAPTHRTNTPPDDDLPTMLLHDASGKAHGAEVPVAAPSRPVRSVYTFPTEGGLHIVTRSLLVESQGLAHIRCHLAVAGTDAPQGDTEAPTEAPLAGEVIGLMAAPAQSGVAAYLVVDATVRVVCLVGLVVFACLQRGRLRRKLADSRLLPKP